jgi:outer membrane autotransporter protein
VFVLGLASQAQADETRCYSSFDYITEEKYYYVDLSSKGYVGQCSIATGPLSNTIGVDVDSRDFFGAETDHIFDGSIYASRNSTSDDRSESTVGGDTCYTTSARRNSYEFVYRNGRYLYAYVSTSYSHRAATGSPYSNCSGFEYVNIEAKASCDSVFLERAVPEDDGSGLKLRLEFNRNIGDLSGADEFELSSDAVSVNNLVEIEERTGLDIRNDNVNAEHEWRVDLEARESGEFEITLPADSVSDQECLLSDPSGNTGIPRTFTIDLSPQIETFEADTGGANYNQSTGNFEGNFAVRLAFDRDVDGLSADDLVFSHPDGSPSDRVAVAAVNQLDSRTYAIEVTPLKEGEIGIELADGSVDRVRDDGSIDTTSSNALATTSVTTADLAPVVQAIDFDSSGPYKAGDVIAIDMQFTDPVDVEGAPELALQVGEVNRDASYVGKADPSTLSFEYTVASDDTDADGVSVPADSLSLPAGVRITRVEDGAEAFLTHAASQGTPPGQVVDTDAPVVLDVTEPADGTYTASGTTSAGNYLVFRVLVSEPLDDVSDLPYLSLSIGGEPRQAQYDPAQSTGESLVFVYAVQAGDEDLDGINVGGAIELDIATLTDPAGNPLDRTLDGNGLDATAGVLVDGTVPTITDVSVPEAGFYTTDDTLSFTIVFDQPVSVVGTPTLPVSFSGGTRQFALASGGGTDTLTFSYTIASSGDDTQELVPDIAGLNSDGAQLVDDVGNIADLSTSGLNTTSLAVVDTIAPSFDGPTTLQVFENATELTGLTITEANEATLEFDSAVLGNQDEGSFEIRGNRLYFKQAPDFENPVDDDLDNSYFVNLRVTDPVGLEDSLNLEVVVNDVADENPPELSSYTPSAAEGRLAGLVNVNGLELTFDEEIQPGPGSIVFQPDSGPAITVMASSDSEVEVNGRVARVSPSSRLDGTQNYTVSVADGAFLDSAIIGNPNEAISGLSLTGDSDPPQAPEADSVSIDELGTSISIDVGEPLDPSSAPPVSAFEVTINGVVATIGDVVVAPGGGSVVTLTGIDPPIPGGADVQVTYTPPESGGLTDAGGNPVPGFSSGAGNNDSSQKDDTRPDITITVDADDTSNIGDSMRATITFSEPVTGFEITDIDLTNAVASNLTDNGQGEYVADVMPLDNGAVEISVGEAVATDAGGNTNQASEKVELVRDAPTLVSFTPTQAEGRRTSMANTFGLTLTFSEPVAAGSGVIMFTNGSGQTRSVSVNSSEVTVAGDQVTVLPEPPLDGKQDYSVKIGPEAIDDTGGASYDPATDSINLVGDTTAPTPKLSTDDQIVRIDFGEEMADDDVPESQAFQVKVNGVVTSVASVGFTQDPDGSTLPTALLIQIEQDITASAELSVSYDQASATHPLTDLAGNLVENFTIGATGNTDVTASDTQAPSVLSLSIRDADGETVEDGDLVTTVLNIDLVFDEPVGGFEAGDVVSGSDNLKVTAFSGAGDSYQFTVEPASNGEFTFGLSEGAAYDVALNESKALEPKNFTAEGFNPVPTVLAPVNGAKAVNVDVDLAITYDRAVTPGTGSIRVFTANGEQVEVIKSNSKSISGAGTKTITANLTDYLLVSSRYYVLVDDGAFIDVDGNPALGISNSDTWSFTTGNGEQALPDPRKDPDVVGQVDAQVNLMSNLSSEVMGPVSRRLGTVQRFDLDTTANLSEQGVSLAFTAPEVEQVLSYSGLLDQLTPSGNWLGDGWAVWSEGRVTVGWSEDDANSSFDFDIDAITVGADKRFTPHLTAGLAMRIAEQETKYGQSSSQMDSVAYSLAGYGSYVRDDSTFLQGALGYSSVDMDSYRRHETGTLSGNRNGDVYQASLIYGYQYEKFGVNLSPYGQIDGSYAKLASYSESGTNAALVFDSQTIKQWALGGGLRAHSLIEMPWGDVIPRVDFRYQYDTLIQSEANLAYVMAPDTVFTLGAERETSWRWTLSLGLDIVQYDRYRIAAAYERFERHNTIATDSFSIAIEMTF